MTQAQKSDRLAHRSGPDGQQQTFVTLRLEYSASARRLSNASATGLARVADQLGTRLRGSHDLRDPQTLAWLLDTTMRLQDACAQRAQDEADATSAKLFALAATRCWRAAEEIDAALDTLARIGRRHDASDASALDERAPRWQRRGDDLVACADYNPIAGMGGVAW